MILPYLFYKELFLFLFLLVKGQYNLYLYTMLLWESFKSNEGFKKGNKSILISYFNLI